MLEYTKVCLRRAWADLKALVSNHVEGSALGLMGAFAGVVFVKYLADADPHQELWLNITYGVAGPVVAVPLAFLFFYWRAPGRIYAEQAALIRELRGIAAPKIETPSPNVSVEQAIAFFVRGTWVEDVTRALSSPDAERQLARFHRAAADGLIPVWARVPAAVMSGLHRVPSDFWDEHRIELTAPGRYSTKRNDGCDAEYINLRTNHTEVEHFFRNQPQELARAKSAARQLSQLFNEGVKERNRLIPPLKAFNAKTIRTKLTTWNDEVISHFDGAGVSEGERSRFATLDTFSPRLLGGSDRTPDQIHLEAIWNKKLDILRTIIDSVSRQTA